MIVESAKAKTQKIFKIDTKTCAQNTQNTVEMLVI